MGKCLVILVVCVLGVVSPGSHAMDTWSYENRSDTSEQKMGTVKSDSIKNQKVNEEVSRKRLFLSKLGYVSEKIWSNTGKIFLSTVACNLVIVTCYILYIFPRLEELSETISGAFGLATESCKCFPKAEIGGWREVDLLGVKFLRRVR